MKNQLLSQIHDHTAVIAVIGLGYVGLPLAVAFAESGFSVVGIDVDPSKVDAINQGRSYISDIPSERLARVTGNNSFINSPIHHCCYRSPCTRVYANRRPYRQRPCLCAGTSRSVPARLLQRDNGNHE